MQLQTDVIDLRKGSPAAELIPFDILNASFLDIIQNRSLRSKVLDYGPNAGDTHVRGVIAVWLSRRYFNAHPSSARISVTGGASQNLACILQCYTSPEYTHSVYLVAPTYHLVCDIFKDHHYAGRLKAIPEDDQGLNIEFLDETMRTDSLKSTDVPATIPA